MVDKGFDETVFEPNTVGVGESTVGVKVAVAVPARVGSDDGERVVVIVFVIDGVIILVGVEVRVGVGVLVDVGVDVAVGVGVAVLFVVGVTVGVVATEKVSVSSFDSPVEEVLSPV